MPSPICAGRSTRCWPRATSSPCTARCPDATCKPVRRLRRGRTGQGGLSATGKRFATTQTHWLRIADGRVIEHGPTATTWGRPFSSAGLPSHSGLSAALGAGQTPREAPPVIPRGPSGWVSNRPWEETPPTRILPAHHHRPRDRPGSDGHGVAGPPPPPGGTPVPLLCGASRPPSWAPAAPTRWSAPGLRVIASSAATTRSSGRGGGDIICGGDGVDTIRGEGIGASVGSLNDGDTIYGQAGERPSRRRLGRRPRARRDGLGHHRDGRRTGDGRAARRQLGAGRPQRRRRRRSALRRGREGLARGPGRGRPTSTGATATTTSTAPTTSDYLDGGEAPTGSWAAGTRTAWQAPTATTPSWAGTTTIASRADTGTTTCSGTTARTCLYGEEDDDKLVGGQGRTCCTAARASTLHQRRRRAVLPCSSP